MLNLDRFQSISASEPSNKVSSKYKFIPTTAALNVLADYGWFPTAANEARTRVIENKGFQKHAIRLENTSLVEQYKGLGTVPQLLLRNSHSGTSSFILQLAAKVFVCSNGLVRASGVTDELRVRHLGYQDIQIADATERLALDAPKMMEEVCNYQNIYLKQDERLAFAQAAIEMRFDGDKYSVDPQELLRTWRSQEKEPTLWNTFNVIQEKFIKGGVRQIRQDRTRVKSRAISSIDENVKLNKALWTLTSEMAKLKTV